MAIESRLAEIMGWSLRSGEHEPQQITAGEACVMEAVAYVAGLPLSDQPECCCPVIASFLRAWNDGLPSDAERDRLLKPLIPSLIGTKSTEAIEERRSYMALDWLIRVHTPTWLDRVESLKPHAMGLRSHEEISDMAGALAADEKVRAARAAARDAAGDADWAAAWAALKPTVHELQVSALDLVQKMIEVKQ